MAVIRFASLAVGVILVFGWGTRASGDGLDLDEQSATVTIQYGNNMIVAVTDQGAAAIRFSEPFERGNSGGNGIVGVRYQWRFLATGEVKEETGSGSVFTKLSDNKPVHGKHDILIGGLNGSDVTESNAGGSNYREPKKQTFQGQDAKKSRVQWRYQDRDTGVIVFDPKNILLYSAPSNNFLPIEGQFRPVLKLESFLYRFPDVEQRHRRNESEYRGPNSMTRRYKTDTPAPVLYNKHVAIVRERSGVATFTFGGTFCEILNEAPAKKDANAEDGESNANEKQPDKIVHRGCKYHYRYVGNDGAVIEGDDVVYERSVNNQYREGRLHLQAGPIHLQWSLGGSQLGWVYYDPAWQDVWLVDAEFADKVIDAAPQRVRAELPDTKIFPIVRPPLNPPVKPLVKPPVKP